MVVGGCPTPHLHRRRRMLSSLVLTFIIGTLFLCYTRFDRMAETAQTTLPLKSPHDDDLAGRPPDQLQSQTEQPPPTSDDTPPSDQILTDLAADQVPIAPMSYGTYGRPPLKDLVPMGTLPPSKLPSSRPGSGRLIVIGDVHGQLHELQALLDKIGHDAGRGDHVVFTGDMINKGPDSPGVVALAMEMGASGVRGNHEDRVLLAWENAHTPYVIGGHSEPDTDPNEGGSSSSNSSKSNTNAAEQEEEDDMLEPSLAAQSGSSTSELRLARTLSKSQRAWLARLPVILDLGRIPDHGRTVVVHAGLVPGVALKRQDPWAAMHMRTLLYPAEGARRESVRAALEDAARAKARAAAGRGPEDEEGDGDGDGDDGLEIEEVPEEDVERELEASRLRGETSRDRDVALPTEGREGRPWGEAWDEAQERILLSGGAGEGVGEEAKEGPVTVLYGHDAKTGLRVGTWSYGLDSSCVRGGELSAMVYKPEVDSHGRPRVGHEIVSVPCRKASRYKAESEEEKRKGKRKGR